MVEWQACAGWAWRWVVYGEQDIVRAPAPLALGLGLGFCLVVALILTAPSTF